jgi:heptose-I-phosphate ethanolaminephosphotransferase
LKKILLKLGYLLLLVSIVVIAAYSQHRALGKQALLYYSFALLLFTPYFYLVNTTFRKIYWIIISIVSTIWCLVEAGHYIQEHSPFNDLALKIFYESNKAEMIEYTKTTMPAWVIIIAVLLLIALSWILLKIKHSSEKNPKWFSISMSVVLLAGVCYYIFSNEEGDKAGFFKDEYLGQKKLTAYYNNIRLTEDQIKMQLAPYALQADSNTQTYVLVIGESTSRHHMGVYNYIRNTTPRLKARKDITIYNDVISGNTSTVECLNRMLTLPNIKTQEHNFTCPTIIDIANQTGMETFWISNQAFDGLFANSITSVVSRAKHNYFAIQNAEQNNIPDKERFDTGLLPKLQEAIAHPAKKKLIILHLMGTHFLYKNRYPSTFNFYTATKDIASVFPFANSEKKLQTINEYDNANRFNDLFVDSVFSILSKTENTQSIYLSDHGDEVYDYRDFIGHTPQGANPWLHDVPFITWNVNDSLLANTNKAFQLSNFAPSLCYWMNIKSERFADSTILFSKQYKEQKRYLNNGEIYTPIKK